MDDHTEPARQPQRTAGAPPSRRGVFGGVLGLGVALPVLAACGSGDEGSGGSDSGGSDPGGSDSGGSDSGGSGGGSASGPLTTTADVPVGGGTIFEDQEVVVTQPTEGDFKAFSASCTHQGCLVTGVTEAGIDCSCHGSVFSLEDGSVLEGPADEALPERQVSVDGEDITVS